MAAGLNMFQQQNPTETLYNRQICSNMKVYAVRGFKAVRWKKIGTPNVYFQKGQPFSFAPSEGLSPGSFLVSFCSYVKAEDVTQSSIFDEQIRGTVRAEIMSKAATRKRHSSQGTLGSTSERSSSENPLSGIPCIQGSVSLRDTLRQGSSSSKCERSLDQNSTFTRLWCLSTEIAKNT